MRIKMELVDEVVQLGMEALQESDLDSMIDVLEKRKGLLGNLISGDRELTEAKLQECLDTEIRLLDRLERERARLLKEMDDLSRSRKAMRKYSPKFPLPPIPAFLDINT
jgi:hypothetical protein